MKTNLLHRKLYTASLIAAIFISSFSSLGSIQVFAQNNILKIRPSGTMGAELSLPASAALMPAASLLPTTVVHITNTSNGPGGWTPSPASPDPSGIDYWPLTGRLLVSDSEVDETPFFGTMNVYQATTSGALVSTCSTLSFSQEPSGVAINPNNNHVFFSDDNGMTADRIFELSLGPNGTYCDSDDSITSTSVGTLYGATDAEDVAYGNNTVFIADGVNAEVYIIPLGANGVLGGGDDGSVTHFDTAVLGFHNVEGIGYNGDSGTLFIVSALPNEKFLGEITTAGVLLKSYDLASAGIIHPEDVTYAPGSLNPAIKNIYLTDRGLDNNVDPNENDGRIFEISLGIPRVSSILRASPNPTSASSVNYTVTFSEPVTGVNVSDFSLTPTGVSGASVDGVTGSGTTYTVSVNTGIGSGTIRLNVTDDNTIKDSDNIELGGSGVGDGNFTSGEVYTVNRPPGVATLTSPSGATTDTTPAYTWNAVFDTTWYYLWVSRVNGDGSLTTIHTKWYDASLVCSAGTCSIAPDVTLSGGNYRWWIQTWNDTSGYGPWSSPLNFSLPVIPPPGAATLVSPNGSIASTTPAYNWNAVSGVTWYYLWVSRVNGDGSLTAVHTKWYDASLVCSGGTCSVTPAGVTLTSGSYRWWVQTWNDGGYGAWSNAMNFSQGIPAPPGAATLVSPNGSIASTTPAYTWNAVFDTTWYYLWVSRVNGDGTLTTIHTHWYDASLVCSGATCSVTPAGVTLTSGSYRWWVQTWNETDYGPWSGPMNFSLP